jgi:Anti-sigma factor NepR
MQNRDGRKSASTAARVLAYLERWFRPADRLDLAIRRWVTPMPPKVNQSVAATRRISRATPRTDPSVRNVVELQAAIGRHLRAECDLAEPIPARLVDLLRQLEQRDGPSEQVAA